jgi:hypothetical protein
VVTALFPHTKGAALVSPRNPLSGPRLPSWPKPSSLLGHWSIHNPTKWPKAFHSPSVLTNDERPYVIASSGPTGKRAFKIVEKI